ncbi:hypothetical protein GGI09_004916 [Coemansia sp. S100]|nr:hypothetical protein LPJ71_002597 [Coemansia sp. S17]KAJ2095348.1 hypothetical protein GGI09_004916 [Coemansia sp. S100]KAJ2107966.1 hypothetical protein GGI16_001317 [Coemansia sp. S142-1]
MTPEQRVSAVFKLLEAGSKKVIDGKQTQLDHTLKVAQLAKNSGADEETVLAALLLNISNFTPSEQQSDNLNTGRSYDLLEVGGALEYDLSMDSGDLYLRQPGFPNKTRELVESQVSAKRYLGAIDSNFGEGFLILPLPLFSLPERQAFEKDPLFRQKVQLAKWDVAARTTDIKPAALDTYREMFIRNMM